MRKKLAILISGRGSNMSSIFNATKTEDFPAEVALVLSDNSQAGGLSFAREHQLPHLAIPRLNGMTKKEHERKLISAIDDCAPDLICLAGYMRLLSNDFTIKYSGRLINIHPSLLPAYKGLDTHARALKDGVQWHGCTVHYVNGEMDGGEIIAQSRVPVLPTDTPGTLAQRVLAEEHVLYPNVIKDLCLAL